MREHRHEAGKIDEVRHRFGFAAIDVDGVTERLKRVETDPEWQHHAKERVPLRGRKPKILNQRVVAIDAEVEVFEETENNEIGNDRRGDRDSPNARSAMRRIDNCDWLMPMAPEQPGIVRDYQTHQPIDERGG